MIKMVKDEKCAMINFLGDVTSKSDSIVCASIQMDSAMETEHTQ